MGLSRFGRDQFWGGTRPAAGEGVPPSRTFLVVWKQKFVSAERRNQRSTRVRSPESRYNQRRPSVIAFTGYATAA